MIYEPTIRPIEVWPEGWRVPRERRPSPFRVRAYEQTLGVGVKPPLSDGRLFA